MGRRRDDHDPQRGRGPGRRGRRRRRDRGAIRHGDRGWWRRNTRETVREPLVDLRQPGAGRMSIFAARRGIVASSFRPPPFPMTLPGLEHWADFSALGLPDNTPVAEAGQVGPKWSQPTAGARPTYRTGANGINGLGALVFDGDDSMVFAATSGIRLFCAVGLEFTVALVG